MTPSLEHCPLASGIQEAAPTSDQAFPCTRLQAVGTPAYVISLVAERLSNQSTNWSLTLWAGVQSAKQWALLACRQGGASEGEAARVMKLHTHARVYCVCISISKYFDIQIRMYISKRILIYIYIKKIDI